MQKKGFRLSNRGMKRDLSISKVGESTAYENHNIRILAKDHDTLLSVTNERGNKEIPLNNEILGTLIGWNVLNNHIVIFTHRDGVDSDNDPDYIYRVDYDGNEFSIDTLFNGYLNFDSAYPIESITSFESDNIQKVYWVDGRNPLRMINIMAGKEERSLWGDNTYFDANRRIIFSLDASISKDNSGNARANGVIQYLITYYNNHGQESGCAWMSDLVYLSPLSSGGAADGTNNNRVTLQISNLDTTWTCFRVYSVFRSSINGEVAAYLVYEGDTESDTVTVIDDAAHLTAVDPSSLLYLGSRDLVAGTITHKDGTLFLGNLISVGKGIDYTKIENAIHSSMFVLGGSSTFDYGKHWESSSVSFMYSDSDDASGDIDDIPMELSSDPYSNESQLKLTSSQILSFKGNEKYRFGLVFFDRNGNASDVFWIGDKVNSLYPYRIKSTGTIKRVVAKCTIPGSVIEAATDAGFKSVQLMIAEATYADRSVKAQGVINPTMFNTWNRYNNRLYAASSWISRPRNSGIANKHFEPVHNANTITGEISCNYWESDSAPVPYYTIKDFGTDNAEYGTPFEGAYEFDRVLVLYRIKILSAWPEGQIIDMQVIVFQAKAYSTSIGSDTVNSAALSAIENFDFSANSQYFDGTEAFYTAQDDSFCIRKTVKSFLKKGRWNSIMSTCSSAVINWLRNTMGLSANQVVTEAVIRNWAGRANNSYRKKYCWSTGMFPDYFKVTESGGTSALCGIADYVPSGSNPSSRWFTNELDGSMGSSFSYAPAFFRKHLMFVDQSVVTLDSPEIAHELVSFDNVTDYKLRIVGVAKLSSVTMDTVLNATHGLVAGNNLNNSAVLSTTSSEILDGVTVWPMWSDYGLVPKVAEDYTFPEDLKTASPSDYVRGGNTVHYWLHMFNRTGKIDGYNNPDSVDGYSELQNKTFANRWYCADTMYNRIGSNNPSMSLETLRVFNYTDSQYLSLNISDGTGYYNAVINDALSIPGDLKYPISYSLNTSSRDDAEDTREQFMYSQEFVPITYASNPHAVMSFGYRDSVSEYSQRILPYIFDDERIELPERTGTLTGALLPWLKDDDTAIQYIEYSYGLPVFTYGPLYEDRNTVSLCYEFPLDAPNRTSRFDSCWQQAVVWASGKTLYTRIIAADNSGGDRKIFLVDISKFYVAPSPDGTTEVVFIDLAPYLEVVPEGATQSNEYLVDYTLWSTPQSYKNWGTSILNLASGAVGSTGGYAYKDYSVLSDKYNFTPQDLAEALTKDDAYFYIGEIYYDYDSSPLTDSRYGGISEQAVQNNRFIVAGPQYPLSGSGSMNIYGNQGDTYFQRWDGLRTKEYSVSSANNVIDIVSVMLETHINLDGRTDRQKELSSIASIDTAQYDTINAVYSQQNNYTVHRDLDSETDLDTYGSSITWSLPKTSGADTDEWMHVTLASTLELDGDKGICRALRRYNNTLIAFQDTGIAEVLFNSRTQLSTTDGVPVEIGNSGRVDGKRYISNTYGCINKWSIVEGKAGLYFVDNLNKAFASIGNGLENISDNKMFGVWFKKKNNIESWNPVEFNNIVAFYDNINSDIYLVSGDGSDDCGCLVYNESLGEFTSFYDYTRVPMIANVRDRIVSFRDSKLWLQNEGLYCNFFGKQYGFWTEHRVAPSSEDKIWTGVEYHADMYRVLDAEGNMTVGENGMVSPDTYIPNGTFSFFCASNEYQSTGCVPVLKMALNSYPDTRKKFRTWRFNVPRNALSHNSVDRMRNPWINMKFCKTIDSESDENQDLMQIHDMTAIYFE